MHTVNEPGRFASGVLALVVHVLFFGFLFFGISWQKKINLPVEVEIWQDLTPAPEPPKPEPPKPAPEPPKPVPEVKKEPPPPPPPPKVVEPPKPSPAEIELKEKQRKQKEEEQRLAEEKKREAAE